MAISTVEIVPNDNFVVVEAENSSDTIAAVFSTNVGPTAAPISLLNIFGDAGEIQTGYMTITSLSDWIDRYVTAYTGKTFTNNVVVENIDPPYSGVDVGGPCTGVSSGSAGDCYNGATGDLAKHWWGVHNYLQYGGVCIVAGEHKDSVNGITWDKLSNPITDKTKLPNIDIIFAVDHGLTQGDIVYRSVLGRNRDCLGIVGTTGTISGYGEPVDGIGGQTSTMQPAVQFGTTYAYFGVSVMGNKEHFGLENASLDIISTPLTADMAGCMARTDREESPWFSPAGLARGRILNVLRVPDQPSETIQNILQANNVNFALTLNGQGTFFFSDRTLSDVSGDPLRFINVVRLYLYLNKIINPLAKQYLFEFNNAETRASFRTALISIMTTIQADGGITDYSIICDETNNTQAIIDDNNFVADITLRPARSISKITLRFTNSSA